MESARIRRERVVAHGTKIGTPVVLHLEPEAQVVVALVLAHEFHKVG